jgi:hypothetical protein
MKKQNAKIVQKQIVSAIQLRIDNATNASASATLIAEKVQFEKDSMTACIQTMIDYGFDFAALNDRLMNNDKQAVSADDYIALYALQKIRKTLFALGQNIKTALDGYSLSILSNLTRLQTLSTINAQRSISRAIEFDETEQQVLLKRLHNCAPSTASTQASSTREAMRLLNICIVHKKHKNDAISFCDNAQAKAIQKLFEEKAA